MLLLFLITHLLSDLRKDAHGVEYEGERSGTLALGSEYAGGVCVCELHKDISEWRGKQSAKGHQSRAPVGPL